MKDVDGDGKADKLFYQIKPWKNDYEGSLVITSAKGKTLWEDGWLMVKGDLEELIETEGAVTGKKVDLKSWVDKYLGGDLNYGLKHERRKLKSSELQDTEIFAIFAKYYGVTPDMTTMAKIVAGGLPGGAVAGKAGIMEVQSFTGDSRHDRFQRVLQQGTFNCNLPSTAAGIAALKIVAEGEATEYANRLGQIVRDGLSEALQRRGVEPGVAVADVPERPAHALLDEVAIIGGASLDHRQTLQECGIARVLVVRGEARHHHEAGALLKLTLLLHPFRHDRPGVR